LNELQLQTGPYRTTYVGTELVRESTPQEWEVYGEILRRVDEAKQWAIGDWLCDGKRHYGDGLYKKASAILGYQEQSMKQFKILADSFDIKFRRLNLSWAHHQEVASLKTIEEDEDDKLSMSGDTDYETIAEMLTWAEKEGASVRDLRDSVQQYKRRQKEEIRLANEPERYSLILADPAWEYEFVESKSRSLENHYQPSSLEDMKRLRVPAADNCILFMWATSPKLCEAIELIAAWGFEYRTCAVWAKDKIGMGYYFRQQHELLFIATKGEIGTPNPENRVSSIITAPRKEHSAKPECVYEIIESMYPEYKRLEMFARDKRIGWDVWGDES